MGGKEEYIYEPSCDHTLAVTFYKQVAPLVDAPISFMSQLE